MTNKFSTQRFTKCQGDFNEQMLNDAKLEELRSKTDRELLILIQQELDRALTLADVAAHKTSAFHEEASKAYRKVVTLLLKTPDMGQQDRMRIEARLKELRLLLDNTPVITKVNGPRVSFVLGRRHGSDERG
jgi:hypothetical protein